MSEDIRIDYGNGMFYEEDSFKNGQLCWKGVSVDICEFGYIEIYNDDGSIWEYGTGYFLNGYKVSADNEGGYCYVWDKKEL